MAFLSQGTNFQKRLNIFSESLGRSARQVRGNEGSRINRHQAQGGQIRRGPMTAATLHYVNMMFTMRKVAVSVICVYSKLFLRIHFLPFGVRQ